MKLGEIIINYRKEHGLSQRQFAEQCKDITNGYISMIENDTNPTTGKSISPKLDKLKCIAEGMGMTLNELLNIADDMPVDMPKPEIKRTNTATFKLYAEDDRMSPTIRKGDCVQIHRDAKAKDGRIAAVMFNGKNLLCRIYHVGNYMQLAFDNAIQYPPRIVQYGQITVLGTAVELKRIL